MNLRLITSLLVALAICLNAIVAQEEKLSRQKRMKGSSILYTGKHPSVVGLEYYDKYICSGTLLTANIILTAAHCVVGKWHALLRVQLKVDNGLIKKGDSGLRVSNIAYNDKFHSIDYINDVGLVKLASNIELNDKIRLVNLASTSGAGARNLQSFAMIAVEVNLKTNEKIDVDFPKPISQESCAFKYNVTKESLDKQWCVELPENKTWAFRYTGGPLMKDNYQVGLVSTSWACGAKVPEVITDLSQHNAWVREKSHNLTIANASYTEIHTLSEEELEYYRTYPGVPMRRRWVPWLVAIVDKTGGTLSCVGVIITRVNVLTTAECAKNYLNKKVRVGAFDKVSYGADAFNIVDGIPHPEYHDLTETSPNLAVLRIDGKFTYNNQTNKAKIAEEMKYYEPESYAYVYGFVPGQGAQSFEVSTLVKEECSYLLFNDPGKLTKQICTRRRTGLCIDGKNGETNSGAPLFIGGRLAALFSWTTKECADYRRPQIHTDVPAHLPWIISVANHDSDEPDSIVTINETNEANDINTYSNVERNDGGLK